MQPRAENGEGPEDPRKQALQAWASTQLGRPVEGVPASSDASFRRYFRFRIDDGSVIGMDAPPPQEDCRPFVAVDHLLADAGVHVPKILAEDIERGFLLLSDMGSKTWLDALTPDNADDWFGLAMDALVAIQAASRPGVLPDYDEALLRRELDLFPQWYLGQHCGVSLSADEQRALDDVFDVLVRHALSQQKVFVHRDFMPRNLMVSEPNPGVIDFQDAVYGPVSYDPICLFKDAFLSWPEQQVRMWLERYWDKARQAGIPVPSRCEQFLHDCDLMGAHRHLKVIGIFARICHRDGKPHYLSDVPRFFAYLDTVIARQPALQPLAAILDRARPQ
ncbi:MAG: phosphotransferase [Alcanivoracaceae bacterium]|nr:phosphotransferase [Alcanivoracaceae bacterium]